MLGKRLRSLREENNLSQIELSKRLGIGNVTLSQYETGARNPDNETLIAISDFFGVSTDYLLGKTDLRNYSDYKPKLTEKDERNIQRDIEQMMQDIDEKKSGPSAYGGELNLSDYDREVLKGSLEQVLRIIKLKNKETYTPNKYRKSNNDSK